MRAHGLCIGPGPSIGTGTQNGEQALECSEGDRPVRLLVSWGSGGSGP